MARRISRKEMKHDEFVEAAFDFGHWIEDNWQKAVGGAVVVVIVILGAVGFVQWRKGRAEDAERLLAQGQDAYRRAVEGGGSLDQAIEQLEQAARKAGNTPGGEVARYYHGLALLERGDREAGVALLEQVASGAGGTAVADTALARLAGAYAAAGDVDRAAETWRRLAGNPEGFYPPSAALLELGRMLSAVGRRAEARQVLNDLLQTHPQSSPAREARTLIDRL